MFNWLLRRKEPEQSLSSPRTPQKNPHLSRSFFPADIDYQLSGWTTTTDTIDRYLASDLPRLVARSREGVRQNPYSKQFIRLLKSNVVGPSGVLIQARTKFRREGRGQLELDKQANDAIEAAFKEWSRAENCDYLGRLSWLDMQNLAIASAGKDGEFLFEIIVGTKAGKYGFQLKALDPHMLDATLNQPTRNGGEIRMGVEYDSEGRRLRYHFCKKGFLSGSVEKFSLAASAIIHGFIGEEVDQSRGIPWMHASLGRKKNLEKYDETVMVASRFGASKMLLLRSEEGDPDDEYGGEDYDDEPNIEIHPGVEDIGNKMVEQFDPKYPHEVYSAYTKQVLRAIAAGLGVSYHSLSNDLEGVNYSSIRTGVLEDREIFKSLQNWFIEQLIEPVYRLFIRSAVLKGAIILESGQPLSRRYETYYPAHFQGRRWAWVDPQKDGNANDTAINNRTRSISSVIREQGGDPNDVFQEIALERERLRELNILSTEKEAKGVDSDEKDESTEEIE